ncbi:MAG: N-6 DNA methylase [bacterium]|nr:N-6 DNA methylase [bacterium]
MQEQAKEKIKALVEKYEKIKSSGKLKSYTEEETKKDLILPLLEALGWNVFDKNEVSAEEHIISSGRVDYGIYLNGRAKFYLEAKKLSADLQREDFANQSIRYSWNKGVTWAVLTDFESFKVFNAQEIDKSLADKLLFEIPYTQYLERFDEQLSLLSKEAFEKGLIDKYAEEHGKKLQKISVSALLYKDLQKARDILTKSLAAWNEKVPKDLLDEGVQKLLDRLIFLRVAEDRGVEPPTLIPMIRQWQARSKQERIYKSMIEKFREFDKIYNSNLFSPHPFEEWEEYDDSTEKVINILYGKKGYYEYDFSAMPADVLGSVYENYLGYRLSQSKKGMTVDKDAKKRKEQGIYYTPTFVVDYIVKNALGPVLAECKSITDLKKIKVLDPACGSGSFLVKALEAINDKYKDFGADGGVYTKLQILTENIYGVDLDEQAVEIARLNLLINALDSKIKLPSLAKNIKNGNSLISDTDEELKKYFGKNFRDKKPFNWQEEFPEVFAQGGFDVIIGNPPYIFARGGNFDENEKKYYYDNFKLQQYQLNTFLLFIEQGYNLLKQNGEFGFIVPNNWLTINSFSKLREFLLKNVADLKIINAIETVFDQASVDTGLLLFQKSKPTEIQLGELKEGNMLDLTTYKPENFYQNDFIINISKSKNVNDNNILSKFEKCVQLNEIAIVKSGLKAYEVGKGIPAQTKQMKDDRVYHSKTKIDQNYFPYLEGKNVQRFKINWSGWYLKYGKCLAASREEKLFKSERILVRQIPSPFPSCINGVFTNKDYLNDINSMIIYASTKEYNLKYILGVINSRLISYWFVKTFDKFQRKIFPQFKVNELAKFPIYPANRKQQMTVVNLVNKMLAFNEELLEAPKNSNKWNSIKEEIEKTDRKIDKEVYELYGLREEEIRIVENI